MFDSPSSSAGDAGDDQDVESAWAAKTGGVENESQVQPEAGEGADCQNDEDGEGLEEEEALLAEGEFERAGEQALSPALGPEPEPEPDIQWAALNDASSAGGAVLPEKGVGQAKGFTGSGGAALQPWGDYAGSFTDGLPHGHGVVTLSHGGRWEGQFRHGYVSGAGVLTTEAGDVEYKGIMAIKDGQLVKGGGYGVWTRAGQATMRGYWDEDELLEEGGEQTALTARAAAEAAAEAEAAALAAEAAADKAAQAARERAAAATQAAEKAAQESNGGGGGEELRQAQGGGYLSRNMRLRNLFPSDSPHLQQVL